MSEMWGGKNPPIEQIVKSWNYSLEFHELEASILRREIGRMLLEQSNQLKLWEEPC
jgi:hypothetical protein